MKIPNFSNLFMNTCRCTLYCTIVCISPVRLFFAFFDDFIKGFYANYNLEKIWKGFVQPEGVLYILVPYTPLEKQSEFLRYNMKSRGKRDTTWNIPRSIIAFSCYISCYIAESRLHLGQCMKIAKLMEFKYHPILLGSGHHYRVHVLSENTAKKGLNFRLFAAKRKISIHPIKTTRSNC